MTQPIFLVGPRGCGKTTIGKALAKALGYAFVDTDHWLLESTRMTVAEIVESEGWPGFRTRETQALKIVTAPSTLVATGGGMVLAAENRQFMREKGAVIYLQVEPEELARRLEAFPEEGQRPTLTGKPVSQEISEVLAEREPLYRQAAHHVINAARAPEQVVAAILAALRLAQAS